MADKNNEHFFCWCTPPLEKGIKVQPDFLSDFQEYPSPENARRGDIKPDFLSDFQEYPSVTTADKEELAKKTRLEIFD